MQYGLGLPQRFFTEDMDVGAIARSLDQAEALGLTSVWVREQAANAHYDLAPIPLLSYAAALTSRVKLGTAVLISILRNPVGLAKSLATLDRLSNGRLIVGVGIGNASSVDALHAFGIDRKERPGRLEEGLALMKALWTGGPVTFHGRYYHVDDVFISPVPVGKPHPPIWFGGHAPAALKRAARLGDGWMEAGARSAAGLREEIAILRQYLHDEGRGQAGFTCAKRVVIAVENDRETAHARLVEWYAAHGSDPGRVSGQAVYGTPGDCVAGLSEVASAGVDLIVLNPLYAHGDQLDRLMGEVVPHVRSR